MEKTNNYKYELDDNYILDYTIDAKNKKTAIKFTLLSLVITFLLIIPFIPSMIKNFNDNFYDYDGKAMIIIFYYASFMVYSLIYIILHELVHGIAYKILTHEKLKFGMTLTVAFCGVPNIYVNKKTSLIATLAPFIFFNIIYIILLCIMKDFTYSLLVVNLAIHNGGCIGDLLVSKILIFRYKNKEVYVNDTGPIQSFYIAK